eukprot:scaffold92126_cov39-Attheya_sp.AAC.1
MDASPPMPASNTTPVRCHSDDDDTRKRKSVCTPTRPTPPRNEPDADVATDVEADVNANVDADLWAQLHTNQGDATPVPVPTCDLEASNNDFDTTKAYSLMRNHFVHTRTSTKQKKRLVMEGYSDQL